MVLSTNTFFSDIISTVHCAGIIKCLKLLSIVLTSPMLCPELCHV